MMLWLVMAASTALAPVGKWNVEYGEAQCVASRAFGVGENRVTLALKPSPTSAVVQINLLQPGSDMKGWQTDAELTFSDRSGVKLKQLSYGTQKSMIRQINLDADLVTALAKASRIDWKTSDKNVTFETGPLGPVLSALAGCRADLREYWNISQPRHEKLKAPARQDRPLVALFSDDDYPRQALVGEQSGLASIVMLIDTQGKVAECMIDKTSGIAVLDANSCIIIRSRAKFSPAIGEDGKPARTYSMQRIRWVIPE